MYTITNSSDMVNAIRAVIDFFIRAYMVNTRHQRTTHDDVTKSNDISNHRGRQRQHKHINAWKADTKGQVGPHI